MRKRIYYLAIFLLLLAFAGGLYLGALNHRYNTIRGRLVMDTWTRELLRPDSTGTYIPCRYPAP